MFGLGWPEITLIAVVALVLFGPKKIPELGAALGKTLRSFREELKKPELPTDEADDHDDRH
ncbi:twin-arginine translocase TatA/TatE family subunit [Trichothermofontia sp.]